MAQKYLHISLPYRYKFEMHGDAHDGTASINGRLKITDASGNTFFDRTTNGRGHTLFVFDYSNSSNISLIEQINYDSYGHNNTTDITEKLKSYRANNNNKYILVILSKEAITNDSDFISELQEGWNFPKNKSVACSQSRRGFAWIGFQVRWFSGNVNSGYTHVYQCDYEFSSTNQQSAHLIEYVHPSIIVDKGYGVDNFARFGRSVDLYSRMHSSDDTSVIGVPCVSLNNKGTSSVTPEVPISIKSGYTYTVRVKFRGRGDGTPTLSKCSSLGFICHKSDWSKGFSYIHSSATAYNEIGQIVEWTYSFTPTEDYEMYWAFYGIIENAWANGADNQTIDLYEYEFSYVDTDGNKKIMSYTDNFVHLSRYFLKTTSSDGSVFYSVFSSKTDRKYYFYHYYTSAKITFRDSDSNTVYCLCDTLERLSYADIEKLYYNLMTKSSDYDTFDAESMRMSNNTLSAYCY